MLFYSWNHPFSSSANIGLCTSKEKCLIRLPRLSWESVFCKSVGEGWKIRKIPHYFDWFQILCSIQGCQCLVPKSISHVMSLLSLLWRLGELIDGRILNLSVLNVSMDILMTSRFMTGTSNYPWQCDIKLMPCQSPNEVWGKVNSSDNPFKTSFSELICSHTARTHTSSVCQVWRGYGSQ